MRLETKEYAGMAAEVFQSAYVKYGSFEEVALKIGTTGHHVSDVAKGVSQPTVPIFFACLAEVAPWLPKEVMECIQKEGKKILAQKKTEDAARAAKEDGCPSVGCLPGRPEEAHA